MQARSHLIRMQRGMYRRLRRYARSFLGGLSPTLKKYYLEYLREFHDFKEVSTKRELLASIQGADIVLCGDYHTLSQAQRTVIRLLREVLPEARKHGRKVGLALEMLQAGDKPKLLKWFSGASTESEFLKAIQFRKNWGFHWDNYRELLELARQEGLDISGINLARKTGRPTLKQRDVFAAKVLADLTERESEALHFVLVGDLHLASSHLPSELEKQLAKRGLKRKVVVIHQNNERFYWKLVERGLEELVDVVRVRENVYCVLSASPWVKLQSHVRWAEQLDEEDEEAGFVENRVEELHEWLEILRGFLGVESPAGHEDFQVRGPDDVGFVERLESERGFTSDQVRWVARCLTEFSSHFIPEAKTIFLASQSVNQAATQAAIYLHWRLSGTSLTFVEPVRDFYPTVWQEALGFFGSKVINHKRKCNGPADLRALEAHPPKGRKEEGEVARLALSHIAAEQRHLSSRGDQWIDPVFAKKPSESQRLRYYKVAKILGHLLGNALYSSVMEGSVTRQEAQAFFRQSFQPASNARDLYLTWVARLDPMGYRNVKKTERL